MDIPAGISYRNKFWMYVKLVHSCPMEIHVIWENLSELVLQSITRTLFHNLTCLPYLLQLSKQEFFRIHKNWLPGMSELPKLTGTNYWIEIFFSIQSPFSDNETVAYLWEKHTHWPNNSLQISLLLPYNTFKCYQV